MDISGSNNDSMSNSDNILGTSPEQLNLRSRTESESSDKVTRFILPSMDGSSPKVLTLDEVAHVFKNIQNMELAHEIALNPEFKLQPYEPPAESLERRIKDILHKAFWDVLQSELQQTPPCYNHAIQLLADIKQCFPQILSPKNIRVLEHINEILDEIVIRQQAEQGVLDFRAYANFVIDVMAKSCAPVRDQAVQNLKQIENVVDTFRGILEIMTLMKLDMANFMLDYARNDIMTNSVEYEKQKFKEYLEYYKFGFPKTESWLKRHFSTNMSHEQILSLAYMDLMDWLEPDNFPEIFSIDKERIFKLQQRAKKLCICASLISVCYAMPIISQRPKNRTSLANQIEIIFQDTTNQEETITNCFEQIKIVINKNLQDEKQPIMDNTTEEQLRTQISNISKNGPVQVLMWKRLETYFRLALRSQAGLPPPPPGYVDFKDELESYATSLKRVIVYNNSVYEDYFLQILKQQHNLNAENNEQDGNIASNPN